MKNCDPGRDRAEEAGGDAVTERANEFLRRIGYVGRQSGPSALLNVYLSDELRTNFSDFSRLVLPTVWRRAEWPTVAVRPMHVWTGWFRSAGYLTDFEDPIPAPTCPLTIYRGATWPGRRGMSWTTDHDRAVWFANRFSRFAGSRGFQIAYLFCTTVEPDAILAMFRGDEAEVVIDPKYLPPLRKRDAQQIRPRPQST